MEIKQNIAIFPGSFDPITLGHLDIVQRALPLFDKIIMAFGVNSVKKTLFNLEQRMEWLEEVFEEEPKVVVDHFEGLTVHYAKKVNANFLIRGLRNGSDFDYEKTISQLNNIIGKSLDTVFFIAQPKYSHISSTIVREIIKGKGATEAFLPPQIKIEY